MRRYDGRIGDDREDERIRGGNGNNGIGTVRNWAAGILGGLTLAATILTSSYRVGLNEQAVVRRFGAYVGSAGPGFHLKAPWPFESVDKIPVQDVLRMELGYRTTGKFDEKGAPVYENVPGEVEMMTKDENIAIVEFSVQYQIADAVAYKFNTVNPIQVLHDISQASMRSVVASYSIDDVLTTEKTRIQTEVQQIIQDLSNTYGIGLLIRNVQLQDVRPPEEVRGSFDNVQGQKEQAEKLRNEGLQHRNEVLPVAKGTAFKMEQDAEAYRAKVINEAQGRAARFLELYEAYKQDPDITTRQLYLQEMKQILDQTRKIIVDEGVPLNLLAGTGVSTLEEKVKP